MRASVALDEMRFLLRNRETLKRIRPRGTRLVAEA